MPAPHPVRDLLILAILLTPLGQPLASGEAAASEERIRVGKPFPPLPDDAFQELIGFPPTPRELENRVVVIVQFQAGKAGEMDEAVDLISELSRMASESSLLAFGVATCFDTRRDALSLDDAFIEAKVELSGVKNLRIVRDRGERFAARLLIRSRGGFRLGSPAIAVIQSSGRVLYTGFLGSVERRERGRMAVRAALALALSAEGGEMHPLLAQASVDYAEDRLGDALRQAEKVLGDVDAPIEAIADAAELIMFIDLRFDVEIARVEAFLSDGRISRALDALSLLRKLLSGSGLTEDVEQRREEIESQPGFAAERAADRAISSVLEELETRDLTEQRTRSSFARRLRRLSERHAGTLSATRAVARAEELEGRGDQ